MLYVNSLKCILRRIYILKQSNQFIRKKTTLLNEKQFTRLCENNASHSLFILQTSCLISTFPVLATTVHTTKGWKFLALHGHKQAEQINAEDVPLACEEGRGAVPHSVVLSHLENCTSVSNQIERFCSLLSITPEDQENRKRFCESIAEVLKLYFQHFKVHQFGSSLNGLGFKGCDVDVCIQTIFDDKDYKILKEVPSLDAARQGDISQDTLAHMHPRFLLRFIRRIFRHHCPDIREPILLIKARCPILRFYNAKYDVFCDFSCENKFSLRNTKLLRFIGHLDNRFVQLAKLVRYWGKRGGFVGDIEMFNSYAFSLLMIHFLQNTEDPVFPPLSDIIAKSEYIDHGEVEDYKLLLQDLKNFEPSKNSQTTEQLLREFFFYFLNFDFSRILLPSTNSSIPKADYVPAVDSADNFEFSTVCVQDPFRPSFNATACATFKTCKRFLNGLIHACTVYQDELLWIPQTSMWGICSLFQPPVSEFEMHKQWQKDLSSTVVLPAKPDAAEKLKKILEYGLLFECMDSKIQDAGLPEAPCLKMSCKVYHNTWQGRNWLYKKYTNVKNNALQLEHLISSELSKSRTESRRQLLCTFYCEGYEIKKDNELNLILTLTFKGSKFPPIVPIFLKEFIPHTYHKMNASC